MKKTLLFVLFTVCIKLNATHNKAGEITYRQVDELTVEATIWTYTNSLSPAAEDRDSLSLCWGDNFCEKIARINGVNGMGEDLGKGYRLNIYTSSHTYQDFGTYILSMTDPNRDHDILNINFPNSELIPFYLETTFSLLEKEELGGLNNSPIFLQKPIDYGYVGIPFQHHPHAVDYEGDSISFKLVTPMSSLGTVVPNYTPVSDIGSGDSDSLFIDDDTGMIMWNAPQVAGSYVIALEVSSYREGVLLDKVIRDFQIIVSEIDGVFTSPQIILEGIDDLSVQPYSSGNNINFTIQVENENVFLSSTSDLYEKSNAEFTFDGSVGNFSWTVSEDDERTAPYLVVFKAEKDYADTGIVSYRTVIFRNDLSLSIRPEKDFRKVQLTPNPAINVLQVNDYSANHYHSYIILTPSGRRKQSGKVDGSNFRIDIGNFEVGFYYLVLIGDGKLHTYPFIKSFQE